MVKDEGLIPTGSFKARGAAVGVSRARELGVERIAMPTNGNAGCGLGDVRGTGRDGRDHRHAAGRADASAAASAWPPARTCA